MISGALTLAYAELSARASQLARYLVSLGAGPGRFHRGGGR